VTLLGARLVLAMMMEAMAVIVQARSRRKGCEVRTHILLDWGVAVVESGGQRG